MLNLDVTDIKNKKLHCNPIYIFFKEFISLKPQGRRGEGAMTVQQQSGIRNQLPDVIKAF